MSEVFRTDIERATLRNSYYRDVIYTDDQVQIVLMNLKPGATIHKERHNGSQFFRVEKGRGLLLYGRNLERYLHLKEGVAVVVPANTFHFVKNTDSEHSLKLYTIYSPPQHEPNTKER